MPERTSRVEKFHRWNKFNILTMNICKENYSDATTESNALSLVSRPSRNALVKMGHNSMDEDICYGSVSELEKKKYHPRKQ